MNNYDNEIFDETIYIINMKMNELKLLQLENRHMIMKLKKTIKVLAVFLFINSIGIIYKYYHI